MSPAKRLAPFLLLLAACTDPPMAPDGERIWSPSDAEAAAKPAPEVACFVRPSPTTGVLVTVSWSRVPVNRILLVKQTLPTESHDAILNKQMRKGRYDVVLGFIPHVAFLTDRRETIQVQTACVNLT